MTLFKVVALVVAVVIVTLVANRNAERDFQPSFRAHLELFLAGVPAGFIGMLLVMPEEAGIEYWAIGIGVLTGLGLSFSIPRRWRYAQEKGMFPKQKRREEQE
jgi:hypothetical protein